jgi:hypothetical protein
MDVPTVFLAAERRRSPFDRAIALGIETDFAAGIGTNAELPYVEPNLLALPSAGEDEYLDSHFSQARSSDVYLLGVSDVVFPETL